MITKDELNARIKKKKDKERREDQQRLQAESKQKIKVIKDQESKLEMFRNDPFFTMYASSISQRESDDQLSQALSESAASSVLEEERSQGSTSRTVWGTKKVELRGEQLFPPTEEWPEHVIITKSHRKKRGKRK